MEPATPFRAPDTQVDSFQQLADPLIDVLFVVDNSASMSNEQWELANHFGMFLEPFLGSGLDWHIGVVSTDLVDENQGGRLHPFDEYRWIDPATPEPELIFSKLVDVGTNGDAAESGLGTTYAALAEHGSGENAGFYREEASFHAVVVSDEDDYTPDDYLSLDDFESWLLGLKGGRVPVTFSSIVNPVGCPCTGPESAGTRYIAATHAVGGTVWDLHDPEGWDTVLDDIANSLTNRASEFYLSRRPVLDTLDIHIEDGTSIPVPLGEGVEYDPERNSVVFDLPPPASSTIVLYYEVDA
jgi:hypothetical protein